MCRLWTAVDALFFEVDVGDGCSCFLPTCCLLFTWNNYLSSLHVHKRRITNVLCDTGSFHSRAQLMEERLKVLRAI